MEGDGCDAGHGGFKCPMLTAGAQLKDAHWDRQRKFIQRESARIYHSGASGASHARPARGVPLGNRPFLRFAALNSAKEYCVEMKILLAVGGNVCILRMRARSDERPVKRLESPEVEPTEIEYCIASRKISR